MMRGMFLRLAGLLILAGLMLAATTAMHNYVFVDHGVYFVDADCYARMSRVQQVMHQSLLPIRHQDFENFPQGVDSHVTAPLDWLIASLAVVLSPFSKQYLDLAGAWISPLLGLATLVLLWAWSTRERLPYRHAMLLLVAVSPILVQAFKLGRPDHQSLLLFFMAAGLAAEWSLWKTTDRKLAIAWGAAWGLALWTSLFEPLVVFGLLLVLRSALLRRKAFTRDWRDGWIVVAGIFAVRVLFDGWPAIIPSHEFAQYFANWSQSIGELAHLSPISAQFPGWLGWLAPALPFLLAWRFWKTRESFLLALLVLTLVTYGLTCWQIRWGCYLALIAALALPSALAAIPSRGVAWTLFGLSLLPVASSWDALLYPGESVAAYRDEQRLDYARLREVANALISNERTGILAPWWLSPPLAYWSGQPCVAGSSHESLAGIVDASRFYLTNDENEAREILNRRNVSYVVAYEPSRVLGAATYLLGKTATRHSLAATIYNSPILAPRWLTPVYSNPFFRIYAVGP
ncbi:MAG: hypothetical protein ACREKL_09235 [Chthoniobacterales bacterium]